MPPGRKPTRSSQEFVAAAIAFADEWGIEQLTLRALGRAIGASTTAVYRYFPHKEALLAAMRDTLIGEAMLGGPSATDPAEQIRSAARAFRHQAIAHPCLAPLMTQPNLQGPQADQIPALISTALYELGLRDRQLVVAYRQLESLVVGTCVFDLAGAPHHLTDRHARMQAVERPEFAEHLVNPAAVEKINEEAFEASLEALLTMLRIKEERVT